MIFLANNSFTNLPTQTLNNFRPEMDKTQCQGSKLVEKKYGLPVENFLSGEINFSLPFLFIEPL
jgi:hypothetical protein